MPRTTVLAAALAVVLTATAALSGCGAPVNPPEPEPLAGVPGTPFSEGGSWLYSYVTESEEGDYPATRFDDLTALITSGELTDLGVSNLMVYGPYASTKKWRGLPPTGDFMDVDPANGTVADFREMASAAHERGITLTIYIALLYLDTSSPLFHKAQADRAAGTDSRESRLLLWDPRVSQDAEPFPGPPPERLVDRPDQGSWAFSQVAQEWYATVWDLPALNYGDDATMDFAKSVIRFWMDNGVQGFEFDAPHTVWGFDGLGTDEGGEAEARHRELVRYPGEYRPDLQTYTMAEGVGTYDRAAWLDRIGYTHVMLNADDDGDDLVQQTIRGEMSIDDLDAHYREYLDERHAAGRGAYAPMLYRTDLSAARLAQDLAVQGGSGALLAFDQQYHLGAISPEQRAAVDEVTRALAASPAEAPAASRQRLAATPAESVYAILRVSRDGSRRAVNVYNLSDSPASVAVDVSGALREGTVLTGLRAGGGETLVQDGSIRVDLDAWGWAFYEAG